MLFRSIGGGMIGMHIARERIAEQRDVVVVEKDPDTAKMIGEDLDCLVLNEDGSHPETLRKAGTDAASWLIALTGSDEMNIVSCGFAAAESPSVRTVARIKNPFYSSLSEAQRRTFGLDVLIDAESETADTIDHIVREGFADDVIPLHDGKLQMRRVQATRVPAIREIPLRDARKILGDSVLMAAAVRAEELVIPDGNFSAGENDELYLLGTPVALDGLLGAVEDVNSEARRVVILGATSLAERIIDRLSKRGNGTFLSRWSGRGRRITVIESEKSRAKELARRFQDVEMIVADSTEEGVLESAGVSKADLVVCATESQSFNVLNAQLAKELGATKSIALTINDRYLALGSRIDVDALVSLKDVVAASVLKTVRRANIRTIHAFYEDDVELVELTIHESSPASGQRLADISLLRGILVAYILRGDAMLVPTGSTTMEVGDSVGLVTRKKSIPVLERVFGGQA